MQRLLIWVFLFGIPLTASTANATTIVVNTTKHDVNSTDNLCSLIEALVAVTQDKSSGNVAQFPKECPAGEFDVNTDTIVLEANKVYFLSNPYAGTPYGLPEIPADGNPIIIEGNGAIIQRQGTQLYQLWKVKGKLHLKGMTLANGANTPGDGGFHRFRHSGQQLQPDLRGASRQTGTDQCHIL